LIVDLIPFGQTFGVFGELASLRHDAHGLLSLEDFLAEGVPTAVELTLVLIGPLQRHLQRYVGSAGRKIHEEGLVWRQGLLLAHPVDGLVGQICRKVIPLFWRLGKLYPLCAFDQLRIVLIRLASQEAIKVFESGASWPAIHRANRARLPHGYFVAFAELGS